MRHSILTPGLIGLAVLALGAGAMGQSTTVKVGEKVPDATFTELLNNDGRKTLAEFRGNVVLFDGWGTH
jgi:hypothetical protein